MQRSDLREARDYVARARAVIEDAERAPDGASVLALVHLSQAFLGTANEIMHRLERELDTAARRQ
jgi:hypothetical protein